MCAAMSYRLFLGGVPAYFTEDQIAEFCYQKGGYWPENVYKHVQKGGTLCVFFVGFSTLDQAAETLASMKAKAQGSGGLLWGHRIRTDWSKDSKATREMPSTTSKAHPPAKPAWPAHLPKPPLPPPAPANLAEPASSSSEAATSAVERGLQGLQSMLSRPVKEEPMEEVFVEEEVEAEGTVVGSGSEAGTHSGAETVPFWPEVGEGEEEMEEGGGEGGGDDGNRTQSEFSEETKSNCSWASSHPTVVGE